MGHTFLSKLKGTRGGGGADSTMAPTDPVDVDVAPSRDLLRPKGRAGTASIEGQTPSISGFVGQ